MKLRALLVAVAILVLGLTLQPTRVLSAPGTVTALNVTQPPYNAVGDGITDVTGPIQSALNAAGSSGGIVFFPEGTYRVTATLNVPSSITMMGAGARSTIRLGNASGASPAVLLLNGKAYTTIRNLRIDGNGANQSTLFAGIFLGNGAHHNTIDGVIVENATAEGIGLYSTTPNDHNIISESIFRNNGVGTTCGQIIVWAGRHNRIVNNTVEGTAGTALRNWGILVFGGVPAVPVQHNLIQGNAVNNTGWGIIVQACASCTNSEAAFNQVSGNVVRNGKARGIILGPLADFTRVVDNSVSDNWYDGIHIISSRGNIVSNNVVTDNNVSKSGGMPGIWLYGSRTTDNTLTGNIVRNVKGVTQWYGILEHPGGPNFNIFVGNNGRNNATGLGIIVTGPNSIEANNLE